MSEISVIDLQKQINEGLDTLKKNNQEAVKHLEENVGAKVSKELAEKMEANLKELEPKFKAIQDHTDKVDAELQKFLKEGSASSQTVNFASEFKKHLEGGKSSIMTKFKNGFELKDVSGRDLNLVDKAVGTMTTAASLGTGVMRNQRIPSILEVARYMGHARALFNQYPTDLPGVEQVKEVVGEGGAAAQTEGSIKAQLDRDFTLATAPIETLASFSVISVQLLEDMPLLNSFLPELMRKDMAELEDAQFIYGNGTAPNISGITDSGNYTAFTAFGPADANAQIMDLLMAVITQIKVAKHQPNAILLHPYEWLQLFNLKDSTNNYLRGLSFDQTTGMLNILGVPVITANYLTAGEYIVGDFINGGAIYDRTGMTVQFFDQDSVNVRYNLVTIRCEERTGLFVKYPASFVYGTATTDIAKIVNWS